MNSILVYLSLLILVSYHSSLTACFKVRGTSNKLGLSHFIKDLQFGLKIIETLADYLINLYVYAYQI